MSQYKLRDYLNAASAAETAASAAADAETAEAIRYTDIEGDKSAKEQIEKEILSKIFYEKIISPENKWKRYYYQDHEIDILLREKRIPEDMIIRLLTYVLTEIVNEAIEYARDQLVIQHLQQGILILQQKKGLENYLK